MSRVERDAYSFTSPVSQPTGTWKCPKASRIFIFLVDTRQKIWHRREKESQDESYELMTSRVDDGTAKGRRQERGGKHFRRTTKERQGFVLIIDDIRHSSIYSAHSRLTTKGSRLAARVALRNTTQRWPTRYFTHLTRI